MKASELSRAITVFIGKDADRQAIFDEQIKGNFTKVTEVVSRLVDGLVANDQKKDEALDEVLTSLFENVGDLAVVEEDFAGEEEEETTDEEETGEYPDEWQKYAAAGVPVAFLALLATKVGDPNSAGATTILNKAAELSADADDQQAMASDPQSAFGQILTRLKAERTQATSEPTAAPAASHQAARREPAPPSGGNGRRFPVDLPISPPILIAILIGVVLLICIVFLLATGSLENFVGQILPPAGTNGTGPFQPPSGGQPTTQPSRGQPTAGSPPQPSRGQPPPAIAPTLVPEVKPLAPTIQPLDLQNAPFLASTQLFFIVSAVLALIWGLLDSGERRELYDWFVVLAGVAIVLFTSKAGILQALFNAIGLNNPKALVAISLVTVILVSVTAGRDLTPVGLFLKLIASGGLILGNMGELQSALALKSGAVLPFGQIMAFIQLKQMDTVWFSLWVYGLDLLAALIFLFEIFSPKNGSSEWGSMLSAIVIIPTYMVCRHLFSWDMLPSLLVANALAVVMASVSRNWGLGTGVVQNRPYGEVQIVGRFQVRTPWDGLLTGGVLLELLVMAMGGA